MWVSKPTKQNTCMHLNHLQMLPKLVVRARMELPQIALEQQQEASSGSNNQVLTTPATIAWMVFWKTCSDLMVQNVETNK